MLSSSSSQRLRRVSLLGIFLVLCTSISRFGDAHPASAFSQAAITSRAQFTQRFSCGQNALTYVVAGPAGDANNQGIRCLIATGINTQTLINRGPTFVWYGEGRWGGFTYRHLGEAYPTDQPGVFKRGCFGHLRQWGDGRRGHNQSLFSGYTRKLAIAGGTSSYR